MFLRAAAVFALSTFALLACATPSGEETDALAGNTGTTAQAMTTGAGGGETAPDPGVSDKSKYSQCLQTCKDLEPGWSSADCRDMCTCLLKTSTDPRDCRDLIERTLK